VKAQARRTGAKGEEIKGERRKKGGEGGKARSYQDPV